MKLTNFTRRILLSIVNLHRKVVLAEVKKAEAVADAAYQAVLLQEKVIKAEQARLEDMRLFMLQAEREASQQFIAANAELDTLPTTAL